MLVREARYDEIPEMITKGKAFEEATKEVVINVDHAIKSFQDAYKSGILTMLRLIDDNGDSAGGLAYIKVPEIYSGIITAVELYWFIYTDKRGCGKILIDAFEESAKNKGCSRVAMIHLVDSFPETLQKFYTKRGYHLTELHYIKEV
jgi:GNAT superfamily N-acetyltransferase